MTSTYMFDKSNSRNIMSIKRQALSIILSFFSSRSVGSPSFSNLVQKEGKSVQKGLDASCENTSLKKSSSAPLTSSRSSTFSSDSPWLKTEGTERTEQMESKDSDKNLIKDVSKEYFRNGVLLGKPLFTITANKVTIQLFYYSNNPISNEKLSLLGDALTRCWQDTWNGSFDVDNGFFPPFSLSSIPFSFPMGTRKQSCVVLQENENDEGKEPKKKSFCSNEGKGKSEGQLPVFSKFNVELQVVRVNYPILDSSIFAQYLTHNAGKYSFNKIMDMLKNSLPTVASEGSLDATLNSRSHITGVKVRLSGRLTTQTSGPRQTVQAGRIGSSSRGLYSLTDYNQNTSKNKLGAFTMKVWISQQSR